MNEAQRQLYYKEAVRLRLLHAISAEQSDREDIIAKIKPGVFLRGIADQVSAIQENQIDFNEVVERFK